MSEKNSYDLAIIGGGPAGLTASIYASRYNVKNVVISEFMGGLASEATEIGNFPSYNKITGFELMQKMQDQAFNFLKAEQKITKVTEINKEEDGNFKLKLTNNEIISAKSVIITSGTKHNKLNIPGEKEFSGKGVSYCATCDGFFYKNKTTAVIGGGNAALTAALHLAKVAKKVYLIHRRDEFRGEKYWLDKVKASNNIELVLNVHIKEIAGNEKTEKLLFEDHNDIEINGVFIEIGTSPTISFDMNEKLDLDEKNHIKVDATMMTNIDGIFAAGDVTNGSNYFKQIATAIGEGSVAANSVYKWL
ncbi:MAG: FAD-dependent oxidoreductase [Clostridiales bacterium]|nr:FAD-dependent oxidoreductase [Clostridiales bacterium]